MHSRRRGNGGHVCTKWTLATLAALLPIVWLFSGVYSASYTHPNPDGSGHLLVIGRGAVSYTGFPPGQIPAQERGFDIREVGGWAMWWWPEFGVGRGVTMVGIPLWMPFIGLLGLSAWLFWRDRPVPPGHCQACGYDLRGNETGRCPECGVEAIRVNGTES